MTEWKRYPDEKPIEGEKILYVSPLSGKVVMVCAHYDDTRIGTRVLKLNAMHVQPYDELYWTPIPEVPADILPEVHRAEIEVRRLRERLREAESLIAELTAEKEQNGENESAIEYLDTRYIDAPALDGMPLRRLV